MISSRSYGGCAFKLATPAEISMVNEMISALKMKLPEFEAEKERWACALCLPGLKKENFMTKAGVLVHLTEKYYLRSYRLDTTFANQFI